MALSMIYSGKKVKSVIYKTIKQQIQKRILELSELARQAIVEDRLEHAELYYRYAIRLVESELPEESIILSDIVHKLAVLYTYQGEDGKADPLIEKLSEL